MPFSHYILKYNVLWSYCDIWSWYAKNIDKMHGTQNFKKSKKNCKIKNVFKNKKHKIYDLYFEASK